MTIAREHFGKLADGTAVNAFTFVNANGLSVRVLDLGGIIQSVRTPDRDGRFDEIVLGYPDVAGYEADRGYMGALIGRFAGRIADGEIEIDGVLHRLPRNSGGTTLHGGDRGFDKAIWQASVNGSLLILQHVSPDGDQGFPGELKVEVTIELTDGNELRLEYRATTSRDTVINFTHHGYWNLAGGGLVRDHWLRVDAEKFLETGAGMVPTGRLLPMDLTQARRLGDLIDQTGGLDHTFSLTGATARLTHPASGRILDIWTDEPGLTVYTANGFDPAGRHPPWSGVALEPEHFPDSPHHPGFPSTILRPGDTFRSTTVHRFSTE